MELSKQELEYPQKLLNYMDGFLISKTMFAACELGVFDLLENEGALPSNAVAERLGTSTDGMDRLLTACVGLQLLQVKQHQGEVLYSNTDLSQVYLTKASPRTLYYSMAYYSQTIYHCFAFLNDAVREGKNQYERAFGISPKDLFETLYRSEEEMLKFMQLMNSIWNICGKDVVVAFDLSIFTHIVDLGGDFFKDPIPDADLYILARIIHDWTEDKCLKLLNRVNKTCKPGSGVLLIEALLNEDRTGPVTAQLYSLNMLVQTEGKERMASEYINLLESAGFKDVQVQRTGKIYDVILGRK
ncbi:acetylserotonin O-methyltransferase isoform X3 [Stegostoma tigrinum]|uniref:acetylserotonin O-methyltransferase isoform X3 n=1 Tax=Stegostoma tigrinum TaxID=3053191 RepID=UPI00202B0764|nr:acetylserotonin O-methyltransferase isoform X3 [Stegostoma tigrinum]